MENSQLLDDCPSSDILCDICGEVVEILNNDLLFSRGLHNQSHIKQNNLKKLDKISDLTEDCLQLPGSNTSSEPLALLSNNLSEICKIENENCLKTLQEQSLEAIPLKESLDINSQLSDAFQNKNDFKTLNLREWLDKILNSLPKKFSAASVSWIKINDLGQVVCILCTCVLGMSDTSIKRHLSCKRHVKKKKKFLPNNLFDNIPEAHLHSFINVIEGRKNNILCNKCNVKIPAHNKCLLAHLEGAVHNRVLAKPTKEPPKNKNMLKCILDDLSEQFETSCISLNEKGEIICIDCNCPVSLCKNVIKEHLAGIKHIKNEKKKIVNRLFENIPENLQGNKSFINVPSGDKTHVFCSMCNVNVPAHHTNLLKHLQDASHFQLKGNNNKDDKSERAKLPKLKRTKTCKKVISLLSLKMSPEASELKCILDDISKEFETSCITINEKREITCVICICPIYLSKNVIKDHLAGLEHKENEKKKVVDGLFVNIPEYQKWIKSFGEKSNVFCSKCNVKTLAHHKHCASHIRAFSKPIEGKSKIDDKSKITKLPELQQTKTCAEVISKSDLSEQFSLLSRKVSSKASELKCIIDDISKQYQTSCIQMNEKGEIICITCNCPVGIHKDIIQKHLSGMRHNKNEKKKVINPLFKNIPKKLHCDKSFIQVLAGDKSNVFCSKCNVKILLDRNLLLEHLQGDEHSTLLGRRQ